MTDFPSAPSKIYFADFYRGALLVTGAELLQRPTTPDAPRRRFAGGQRGPRVGEVAVLSAEDAGASWRREDPGGRLGSRLLGVRDRADASPDGRVRRSRDPGVGRGHGRD